VQRLPEQTVSRDAIAFGEDHEISRYNLTPRDAPALAVTDHEGARAREIAERLERMLRASCLNDRDRHHDEHEAEQHQRVGWLPEKKVHNARRDQHEEHGLAHHLEDDREQVALLLRKKLVRSVLLQTSLGIRLVKTDKVFELERVGHKRNTRGNRQAIAWRVAHIGAHGSGRRRFTRSGFISNDARMVETYT